MPGFNSLCQRFKFLRFFALLVAALQRTMHSVTGCYVFIVFFAIRRASGTKAGSRRKCEAGGRHLKNGDVCGWVGMVEAG